VCHAPFRTETYVTGLTSEGRSSSSTEPIWIRFETLGSEMGELHLGLLLCTLTYFLKSSPNHMGRRFCLLSAFARENQAHFLGFHIFLQKMRVVIEWDKRLRVCGLLFELFWFKNFGILFLVCKQSVRLS
jgi:hypothetical protein